MSAGKVIMLDLGIVGASKLEALAKKNQKSVTDFVVLFFNRRVQCTRKKSASSKR
jgi:hypothetical protein